MDRCKICREERADVRTGREDKSHEEHLTSRIGKSKSFAVLIGETEIGHRGVDRATADFTWFFGRYGNVREPGSREKCLAQGKSEDKPANFRL